MIFGTIRVAIVFVLAGLASFVFSGHPMNYFGVCSTVVLVAWASRRENRQTIATVFWTILLTTWHMLLGFFWEARDTGTSYFSDIGDFSIPDLEWLRYCIIFINGSAWCMMLGIPESMVKKPET